MINLILLSILLPQSFYFFTYSITSHRFLVYYRVLFTYFYLDDAILHTLRNGTLYSTLCMIACYYNTVLIYNRYYV